MKAPLRFALGLAIAALALGLSGLAAQEERKNTPPDPKRVTEMVAELKQRLENGLAWSNVLGAMGDRYAYALIQMLDDPKVDPLQVFSALSGGGGDAAAVVAGIVKYLQKEGRFQHRHTAVKLLWKYGHQAVPALLDILQAAKETDTGKNFTVRSAALWALGTLDVNQTRRDLNALVLALGPVTKHKELDVRRAAVETLGRIQVRDEKARMLPHPAFAELLAALKDDDAKVRELAAKALGDARGLPEQDKKAIPGLLELALSDHKDESRAAPRWFAIHALVFMGDQGLKPLLDAPWGGEREVFIRGALMQALVATSFKSDLVLSYLLGNLGDPHALQALAQRNFGEAAKAAIPSLLESLKGGREYDRVWA